jgi:hypothetical protein
LDILNNKESKISSYRINGQLGQNSKISSATNSIFMGFYGLSRNGFADLDHLARKNLKH